MKVKAALLLLCLTVVLSQGFLEGGLHDYIYSQSRETLSRWAFAAENYHRKLNNQEFFEGGLVDYINNLSNQEIASYILKQADEHPEIASREKLDALSQPSVGKGPIGGDGGLHDYIWRLPREKLITWAITAQTYHRDVKHQHLFGGLEDYVNTLSNDQIVDYILAQVKEHPELALNNKLDALAQKYGITAESAHDHPRVNAGRIGGDGGLHDFIWRMERSELEQWALATEEYHREKNNLMLVGGLHDYIATLNKTEIINYIMNEIKEHPEIASAQKLNGLVKRFNITNETSHAHTFLRSGGDGGLHDFIWRLPRDVLTRWALAAEEYHREVNKINFDGGLHDYIATLNNSQIIDYIMAQVKEHPEIASANKLDGLVNRFNISAPEAHPVLNRNSTPIGGDGGLHDFIWRMDRNTLEKWALATESYHRGVNNLTLLGGLDDYIANLTNQQVIDYIMREVKEHPEIASAQKLNGLVSQFGLNRTVAVGNNRGIIGGDGGLHDFIWRLPRKTVENWALACERYHRKMNNQDNLIGGLHDYISNLTVEQVNEYILKEVKEHPEIASAARLDGLVSEYGISQN